MNKHQLKQLIREEIQNILSKNEKLEEGVIKNLTIAALLGLAAAAGISPDAQAQTKQHFQKENEKITRTVVSVVNNKGQVKFRDIEEFKKHFENNVQDYQDIGIKPNSEFFILIKNVPFVGYVGVSKDMQTSLKKAGLQATKAGKKSGFLLRDVKKAGNNYVGIVVHRI